MVLTVGCTQGLAATADGDSVATPRQELRHAVRYQYETRLYRHGDDLYLVTLSLEWPQRLNASTMPALQHFLTSYLLGSESEGMLTGLRHYFSTLGERLTAMPDDDSLHRHYIELSTQLFWYEPNRYVSLYAYRQERDGEGHILETKHRFFTYDLPGDRILTQKEVFNHSKMWGAYSDQFRIPFEEQLVKNAVFGNAADYVDISKLPRDMALMGDAILFDLGGAPEHASYNNLSFIAKSELTYIFEKSFKKYLEQAVPDVLHAASGGEDIEATLDGVPVTYTDTLPEYPGGQSALMKYMAGEIKYPAYELSAHIEGKVVVSAVVNTDGALSDLIVLNPVSPGLAREAVRVFREMTRWQPGIRNGRPVTTRVSVPVAFKFRSSDSQP